LKGPPPVAVEARANNSDIRKLFLTPTQINGILIAVSFHKEGRWPSSLTLERDAVDAAAQLTSGAEAYGEVVSS
jgi:hypothetical protein